MKPQKVKSFKIDETPVEVLLYSDNDYKSLTEDYSMGDIDTFAMTYTGDTANFYKSRKIDKQSLVIISTIDKEEELTKEEVEKALQISKNEEGKMMGDLFNREKIQPIVQSATSEVKQYCRRYATSIVTSDNPMLVADKFLSGIMSVLHYKGAQPNWWPKLLFEIVHHIITMKAVYSSREIAQYAYNIMVYTCYLFETLTKSPYAGDPTK